MSRQAVGFALALAVYLLVVAVEVMGELLAR